MGDVPIKGIVVDQNLTIDLSKSEISNSPVIKKLDNNSDGIVSIDDFRSDPIYQKIFASPWGMGMLGGLSQKVSEQDVYLMGVADALQEVGVLQSDLQRRAFIKSCQLYSQVKAYTSFVKSLSVKDHLFSFKGEIEYNAAEFAKVLESYSNLNVEPDNSYWGLGHKLSQDLYFTLHIFGGGSGTYSPNLRFCGVGGLKYNEDAFPVLLKPYLLQMIDTYNAVYDDFSRGSRFEVECDKGDHCEQYSGDSFYIAMPLYLKKSDVTEGIEDSSCKDDD